MLDVQLEHFKKTPLLTNIQPDYSRVGNSELVDHTVRSNNWILSDTIFIENEQIEALSNRPPWIAALLEQGLPGKPPDPNAGYEGISPAEKVSLSRWKWKAYNRFRKHTQHEKLPQQPASKAESRE